jgi:tRNA pseudouridine55 synthase
VASQIAMTAAPRRRRGVPIHGWLVIDKPLGVSSAQVVGTVRRATGAAKAGHAGTLDPLATGVLPIALGEATKTIPYMMDGPKTYRFAVRWGEATSTDDAEGEIIATGPSRPTPDQIRTAVVSMTGEIEQVPPAYSAVHVAGKRAYVLARAGHSVDLSPRRIVIHRFELLERPDDDHAVFEAVCGKGTYIRSLARDLAATLGTFGHVSSLRRTATGPFHETQAISLESLQSLGHSPAAFGHLLPVETVLDDIPALDLTDTEANRLRRGQPVGLTERLHLGRIGHLESGCIVWAKAGGKPVALARFEAGGLRPVRVLNL